jgi:hypothetical protein
MAEHQIAFDGPLGTLRGMFHLPEGDGPLPAVVMLHGFTGQHIENTRLFVQAARHFAGAGYAVLRMDFYGSGDSDGAFDEMTVQTEVEDATAMLYWLETQPSVDAARIAVLGLSMGGAVTALLASRDARVKAAVLWNAVGLPNLHFGEIAREGPDAGDVDGVRVSDAFLDGFYALDLPGALASYTGPGLVVRGTADDVVFGEEADTLAAALGERGTLVRITDADHTFNHHLWRADLFARTLEWLDAQL